LWISGAPGAGGFKDFAKHRLTPVRSLTEKTGDASNVDTGTTTPNRPTGGRFDHRLWRPKPKRKIGHNATL